MQKKTQRLRNEQLVESVTKFLCRLNRTLFSPLIEQLEDQTDRCEHLTEENEDDDVKRIRNSNERRIVRRRLPNEENDRRQTQMCDDRDEQQRDQTGEGHRRVAMLEQKNEPEEAWQIDGDDREDR